MPFPGFSLGQFLRSSINLLTLKKSHHHAEYSCYNWIYSFSFFLFKRFILFFIIWCLVKIFNLHAHTKLHENPILFLVFLFIVLNPGPGRPGAETGLGWRKNPVAIHWFFLLKSCRFDFKKMTRATRWPGQNLKPGSWTLPATKPGLKTMLLLPF